MGLKEKINAILGLLLIIFLFIFASYLVQNNIDFFKSNIKDNFSGMIIYTLIVIVSIIIAPINEIVLIPLATALWGWIIAALLTLVGWTIGASIAFFLARRYGISLVKKLFSLKKIYQYQKVLSHTHTFLGIILLRLVIPIDVVSYAIGIFMNIRFINYFFATILGFLPLAFFLAYMGTLPALLQIGGTIIFALVLFVGYLIVKNRLFKKEVLIKRY